MKNITVGTDIELFVQNHNGELVSMMGKLGADKHHPRQIDKWQNLSIQEDGISCEITFDPQSPAYFVPRAQQAVGMADEWLRNNLGVSVIPSACEVDIGGAVGYDPHLDKVGCDPDFDAYVVPQKPRPKLEIEDFGNVRFGSGHLHFGTVGYGIGAEVPAFIQAQFADLFIGVPFATGIGRYENRRRQFYGRPGLYRPKPYGFEYRTPANLWLWNANNLRHCIEQFQDIFQMKLVELKALYKKVNWTLIRTVIEERRHEDVREQLIEHYTELKLQLYSIGN